MKAFVLRHEEIDSIALECVQEGCVDQVVRPPQGAEFDFKIRVAQTALLAEGLIFRDFAKGNSATFRILVAGDVVTGCFVDEDRDLMSGSEA
nr:hypothetical protein [Ensifer sp. 1H6]